MSLEAVQKVTATEEKARQRRIDAEENAKKLVAEAERSGRELVASSRTGAEAQVKELLTRAEQSAAKHAALVMEETRHSCDGLRHAASGKLEKAAALIIRRVVNI